MTRKAGILLAAILCAAAPAVAQDEPSEWLQEQTRDSHAVRGLYVNTDYGFALTPPPGDAMFMTDPPNPNHGVIIILGEKRSIAAFADYTNPDAGLDKPCDISLFHAPGVPQHASGLLGGRAACALTLMDEDGFGQVLEQRRVVGHAKIRYVLRLTTTPDAKAADLAAFHGVAASFEQIPAAP